MADDVLAKLTPKELAGWYGRLADQIGADSKVKGISVSLAALLMKRWLDTSQKGTFRFTAPPHLISNPYVKEALLYHRKVYLTDEKARIGKSPNQKQVWAGVIPRLQDGRWKAKASLDVHYESLVEIPLTVQAKAWLGQGNAGDLDLLYSLHGFQVHTEVTVTASPKAGSNRLKITFTKFKANALDRYDWDPAKHITVPNPDYGKSFAGAVEPKSENITVYHTNARRLESAGLAAPYDLESEPWNVVDVGVTGPGEVDPQKKL